MAEEQEKQIDEQEKEPVSEKDKQYAKSLMDDIYNDMSSDEDEEEPDLA
jgi:hypothetical protein